jgi:hypothetical protein
VLEYTDSETGQYQQLRTGHNLVDEEGSASYQTNPTDELSMYGELGVEGFLMILFFLSCVHSFLDFMASCRVLISAQEAMNLWGLQVKMKSSVTHRFAGLPLRSNRRRGRRLIRKRESSADSAATSSRTVIAAPSENFKQVIECPSWHYMPMHGKITKKHQTDLLTAF